LNNKYAELTRKGYTVTKGEAKQLSEDMFGTVAQVAKTNAILNLALDDVENAARSGDLYDEQFDDVLVSAIAESEGLFVKALGEMTADIFKGRGSRQHLIKRVGVTGLDVAKGYEEDVAKATVSYLKGVAGCESKRIMATNMIRAFTGTDIDFDMFVRAFSSPDYYK